MLRPLVLTSLACFCLSPATALAARSYHPTLAAGKGKRKARVLSCNAPNATTPDKVTTYVKLTTRKSSDSRYPRIAVDVAEGSSMHNAEQSLFPGDLTIVDSSGPWSGAATVHLEIHRRGHKTKKKDLTVGAIGAC